MRDQFIKPTATNADLAAIWKAVIEVTQEVEELYLDGSMSANVNWADFGPTDLLWSYTYGVWVVIFEEAAPDETGVADAIYTRLYERGHNVRVVMQW